MIELIDVRPSAQTAMAILLLLSALVIVRSLLHKSKDTTSAIDLDDLILDTDPATGQRRVSIIRVLALGAFALTVWMMVFLTMSGKMTEGYFTIFNGAWVAPLMAQIIWGKKPPLPTTPPDLTKKDP